MGGKCQGWGEYTWTSGSYYKGEWRDGKKHGHGTYTFANGDIHEGEWENGEATGHGKRTGLADGSILEGRWKDSQFEGLGRLDRSGETYVGQIFMRVVNFERREIVFE